TMASGADKGKEVSVARKGFKRLMEGVSLSSSTQKAPPARSFGAKAVEEHGIKCFNTQKEAKYALENWIDKGRLALEFRTIWDTIRLGLGYVLLI
ncbi:hypothetical protein HAX54_042540, partial [Datura stramonium]|nr:hypothetical protein [Datura stramonium]